MAYLVSELDSITTLSYKYLKKIADDNDVYRINIFDVKGNKVASSYTHDSTHESLKAKYSPSDFISTDSLR